MKCGACQRDCRTTQIAHVASADGAMRRARVCSKCFNRAFHIVVCVTTVEKVIDEMKVHRRESRNVVAGAIKKLRGIVRARRTNPGGGEVQGSPEGCGYEGETDGIERAIELLETGDF
jgi:hypothetical protein